MLNGYNREKEQDRSDTGGREGGGGGGEEREGGMESESVRRERRMESARGRVHLTSGRARAHAAVSVCCFFCAPTIHPIAPPWLILP